MASSFGVKELAAYTARSPSSHKGPLVVAVQPGELMATRVTAQQPTSGGVNNSTGPSTVIDVPGPSMGQVHTVAALPTAVRVTGGSEMMATEGAAKRACGTGITATGAASWPA